MTDEQKLALDVWLGQAVAQVDEDFIGVALLPAEAERIARAVLDRLAAEDSPVLLVARGDVEERVEWAYLVDEPGYKHDGELFEQVPEIDARRRCAEGGAHLRTRTVRSWSLPDGSRVEVTGPWTEAKP